jgi:MFS family permease
MTAPKLDARPSAAEQAVVAHDTPASAAGWRALPVLMAGTFLIVLDFFVVNVTIPSMQAGLHASTSAVEWIVAGYGLTFAVFLVTAGRLGDRIVAGARSRSGCRCSYSSPRPAGWRPTPACWWERGSRGAWARP